MGNSTLHATLSPSARHRWGVCPGSVREEAKYPEQPGGAAANDGTRTHTLLEQCIKNGLKIDPTMVPGVINDEYGSYTLDAERLARINLALDYIWALPNGRNAVAERRVHPDGFVGRADMSGTVDVQIPDQLIYEIIDYKDGMHPVSAINNPQLEQYALGALAALAEPHPKSFQLTIIQPKLALRGMPIISTWNLPTVALLQRAEVMKAEADATDDPNAPLIPGESQCKYCRAKGACPALASKVMNEVSVMFQAINPNTNDAADIERATFGLDVAQQAATKDPTVMDDNQLRQILEAAPLVRQLLAGVEAEVQRRLEAGHPVEGFKLVRGRGSRSWALPEDEMVKKLTGMGVPKGAIYETSVVSPAKAEKLTWDKKGVMTSLSDIQLGRMRSEYVTNHAGKLTVAPDADPREAVVTNAAPMFSAVEVPSFLNPPAILVSPVELPDWMK